MKIKFYLSLFLIILFLFFSCKTPDKSLEKPSILFKTYNGKAVITSIVPSKDDNGKESSMYMQIYFDFIPADSLAPGKYEYPESADTGRLLYYDNRNSFHNNWIQKWGIKSGNEYPAMRVESNGEKSGAHIYYEVELHP